MNLPLLYNWLDAFDRIAPYANGLGDAEDIDRFTDTCYILIENCGLMPQSPESDVWLSKKIAFAWLEDYILHIADVDRPRLFESIFDHCFLMFQFAYDYIGNPSKIQCEAEKVWLYYFTIRNMQRHRNLTHSLQHPSNNDDNKTPKGNDVFYGAQTECSR